MKEKIKDIILKQKGREFMDVIDALEKETHCLEQIKSLSDDNIASIKARKGILFFLKSTIKPAGLSNSELLLLQPLVVEWIEKGQLEKSVLKHFND